MTVPGHDCEALIHAMAAEARGDAATWRLLTGADAAAQRVQRGTDASGGAEGMDLGFGLRKRTGDAFL